MMLDDRVRALQQFGFTARQARFVALVALHGGFCLRRQYATFAGTQNGKNVGNFLESLVSRQLAERLTFRADRGHIYHLRSRAVYHALRQDENRNRRAASTPLIARKLMVLDYVLAHGDVEWLATEQDKVAAFTDRFGVPAADLPQKVYAPARPGDAGTTRYFTHKLPIAVVGDPPVAYFVYLALDGRGVAFEQFLHDHRRLFARLPIWTVVAIGTAQESLTACDAVFSRDVRPLTSSFAVRRDDLRWFFDTRRAVEQSDVARFTVADIERFHRLREHFNRPLFERQYRDWLCGGGQGTVQTDPSDALDRPNTGRFISEVLRFDYTPFGSLPGVA